VNIVGQQFHATIIAYDDFLTCLMNFIDDIIISLSFVVGSTCYVVSVLTRTLFLIRFFLVYYQ